jgi:hypothetical protein
MFHAFLDMGLSENRIYIYIHTKIQREIIILLRCPFGGIDHFQTYPSD